jgi:two-component system chemotaxis sensor kinase CheA
MSEDPYKYFRLEAAELLDELVRCTLALEKARDESTLAKALRHAHTLKGAARVVRLPALAELAHELEDVLGPYRTRATALAPDDSRRALALLDELAQGVRSLDEPAESAASTAAAPAVQAPRPAVEARRSVRADLAQLESLLDAAAGANVSLRGVTAAAAQLARVEQLAQVLVTRLGTPGADANQRRTAELADELREQTARCARALQGGVQQSARELAQVVELAEQVRHVRVDSIEVALQRTARDAAEALGKSVELHLTGGDVRVEADVLSSLQDALVQLVRNAVAHGIEAPAQRARAGKPPVGTVSIDSSRHRRGIVIRCSDDGGGLDVAALEAAARRQGLEVPAGDATPQQLIALLARGGLTTAAGVTPVAGRGVGLDVVAEVARRLGGELDVDSHVGRGTTFSIALPAALSALEVLGFECAGARLALPLRSITVVRRLRASDIVRTSQHESVVHGDSTVPLVRLARSLRGNVMPVRGSATTAVIIATARGSLALEIDRVIGISSVIVRAIPDFARVATFVAGASVDVEGRAQLVLDPDELAAQATTFSAPAPEVPRTMHRVLVIDDSLTTRMLEQSILEAAGYQVDTASSAEAGLEAARGQGYALFLVDVEMPGMDGFSFIERIRADDELRDTPAILISSRNDASDFQRGRDAGAQGYIVKSEFDQIALLSQISALLRSRHG